MSAEQWSVVAIVITLCVAGYSLYIAHQAKKNIDVGTVVHTLEESVPLAQQIIDVAQTAVNSIEQIRRQPGNTMTNSEAFARATNTVRKWFPSVEDVTDEQIITAINSAVLVASSLTNGLKADKAAVAEAENRGVIVDGKQTT